MSSLRNHVRACRPGYALVLSCVWFIGASSVSAQQARWVTQLLRKVPGTHEELAAAYDASKNASIQVEVGEPMQVETFSLDTSYDITVGGQKEKRSFKFERLGALTFGLSVSEADQANLPSVSKGTIMTRVTTNYISIQLRPQRDVETGAIYLYYKPFAAIGSYEADGTHEFSPLMEDSVREFRGIGLFVKQGTPITAEALRTFVAVNKTLITDVKDPHAPVPKIQEHYELTFGRAYVDGEKVTLHTFVTNEFRQWLHYLKPYSTPKSLDDCSVESVLYFTKYTAAKQSPSEKALRSTWVNGHSSFRMSDLDQYAADNGMKGTALENLTEILDAIIAGKVPSKPFEPVVAGGE